jgi:DNA processing protein
MKLNNNALILAMQQVKNLGRKKIYKSLIKLNLEYYNNLENCFSDLKIHQVINYKDFQNIYKTELQKLKLFQSKNVTTVNLFENDEFGFYKNKVFCRNAFEINEYPIQLFVINKTKINLEKFNRIFTVIGSRNSSNEAIKITHEVSAFLSNQTIPILSGLARGIDTVAHKSTIKNNGIGIAVLGNGLDSIYPAENRPLALNIVKKGMLVSEYTFGLKAERFRLIERDRLQAMMATDVILIESEIDGGSMHAVNWAIKLKKNIWCFNSNASGNQKIIKEHSSIKTFKNLNDFKEKFNISQF